MVAVEDHQLDPIDSTVEAPHQISDPEQCEIPSNFQHFNYRQKLAHRLGMVGFGAGRIAPGRPRGGSVGSGVAFAA